MCFSLFLQEKKILAQWKGENFPCIVYNSFIYLFLEGQKCVSTYYLCIVPSVSVENNCIGFCLCT